MTTAIPSAAELQSLSLACDRLWHLDKNRLEPGVHYRLNLQQGKTSWQHGDVAADPLFKFVDPCVFDRPTFRLFQKLLDNYERGVGMVEKVTAEELSENNAFLNAVLDTAPMRYAYNWLTKTKKFVGDASAFKKKLDTIWFGLYRRQVNNDSSGFEHVFLGEEKDGKICGCHNWIQIFNEERAGRLNYLGYIRPNQRGRGFSTPQDHEQLISIQFMWEKEIKPVSTSLIGVSPEFEMALYTMCFLNGREDNHVQLGPYCCNIKCFAFGRPPNVKVGSAFPDALPLTNEQAAVKIQAAARGCITRSHERQNRQGQQPLTPHHHHYQQPPPPHLHHHHAPAGGGAPSNAWNQPRPTASPSLDPLQPTKPQDRVADPSTPAAAGGAWGKPRKW